ncbi:MAG: hypothetical protein JXQ83_08380, partial [Candidatus Glassbacteria bacterium]|nr:hypothetical protein [Candidatus Glassbacteria bacterium]
ARRYFYLRLACFARLAASSAARGTPVQLHRSLLRGIFNNPGQVFFQVIDFGKLTNLLHGRQLMYHNTAVAALSTFASFSSTGPVQA